MKLGHAFAWLIGACTLAGGAHAVPPLADYAKAPAVSDVRLSPAGDRISYLAEAKEGRNAVVARVGGTPLFALKIGALKLSGISWLDEGHLLAEAEESFDASQNPSLPRHFQGTQSAIIDAASGKVTIVFAGDPRVYPATFGFYGSGREGAASYGYFGGLALSDVGSGGVGLDPGEAHGVLGNDDLYRVNLDTGRAEIVAKGIPHHHLTWVVSPAGVVVAHSDIDRQSRVWRLYAGADNATLVSSEADSSGDGQFAGLGRTADSVLVERFDADAWAYKYTEYPLTPHGAGVELFKGQEVQTTWMSSETGLLDGVVTAPPQSRLTLFDPIAQAKFDKVKRALGGEAVTLVSATDSFDQMIVKTEGPGDSGTYFRVDLKAGSVKAIGWDYPTILQADVAAYRTFAYKAADGLALEGVLTLPLGRPARNAPLIVLPHGLEGGRSAPGFDWWAQAYASRGYAVFQPNYRGSGGYGKAFLRAGDGEWGRKRQSDVSDGVAELARQGIIDPRRVCIVGSGDGGYMALAGVTVQQGLYRCAVSVGGMADLNDALDFVAKSAGPESERLRHVRRGFGARENRDPALDAYSPRRLAARADAPILLIYGTGSAPDSDQSRNMAEALRQAGKPVEVVRFADDDHWLQKVSTRTAMLEASVAFVEKNNPPDAASVAAK